jgi:hypothetical protein
VNRSNLKVRLYEHRGSTSAFIDAEIDSTGQLFISGQDIGDAPKEHFGDSDYEYWIVVPSEQKDSLLLILLQELYSGNSKIISDFLSFLKSRGIGHKFESYA